MSWFFAGDEGYDSEIAGFQTALRHRPSVVVAAESADDVAEAVTYAGAHGLRVAVQATGHGAQVAADGMLISTRRMAGVRIDAVARTAWVEAGVRWSAVIEQAAAHGLAPLSGSSPGVGAVGYTVGGGIGLLGRQFGYTADHVTALDVVTADGRRRHVTATSEPDLFWALRGSRDPVGIVTGLEVALVPLTSVHGGGLYFDTAHATEVLSAFRELTATAPAPGPVDGSATSPGEAPGTGSGTGPEAAQGVGSAPVSETAPGAAPGTGLGPGPEAAQGVGLGAASEMALGAVLGTGLGTGPETTHGAGSGTGPEAVQEVGSGPASETTSGAAPGTGSRPVSETAQGVGLGLAPESGSTAAPETLTASLGMVGLPSVAGVAEPLRGKHVLHVRLASTVPIDPALLNLLRAAGPRLVDRVGPVPVTDVGSIYGEPDFPHAYVGDNVLLDSLPQELLDTVFTLAGPDAAVPCVVDIRHLGGAMAREPSVPNAVPYREATHILRVLSPVGDLDAVRSVHRAVFAAAAPFTVGRSATFRYGPPDPESVLPAPFDPVTWSRLAQVRSNFDPEGRFLSVVDANICS